MASRNRVRLRWRHLMPALLLIVVLVQPALVGGEERGWVIVDVIGDVRLTIASSGQVAARPMRQGDMIEPGQTFVTGPNASAKLVNGHDLMVVQPNSVVQLPAAADPTLGTRIQQRLGRVLFSVEPRRSSRFAVETPLLLAVVKGTKFDVNIADTGTSVTVFEGTVETTALGSGAKESVSAGQTVNVSSGFEQDLAVRRLAQSDDGNGGLLLPLSQGLQATQGIGSGGAVGGVGSAVSGSTSTATGLAGGVSGAVSDTVNDVSGAVGNTVESLTGGL